MEGIMHHSFFLHKYMNLLLVNSTMCEIVSHIQIHENIFLKNKVLIVIKTTCIDFL